MEAQYKTITLIKAVFDEKSINIPFRIRTLDFGKNSLRLDSGEQG